MIELYYMTPGGRRNYKQHKSKVGKYNRNYVYSSAFNKV